MRILILIIIFLLNIDTSAQNSECMRNVEWGDVNFCLPEVKGMIECYENPKVKERINAHEFSGNTIFGVYIPEQLYNMVDSVDRIVMDEYFKFYAVNNMKDRTVLSSNLTEIDQSIQALFSTENWDNLKGELEKNNSGIQVGMPVIIDNYNLNERSLSYILIGRLLNEVGEEKLVAMALDVMLIKDRIIWMGYYLNYSGEDSLKEIKVKNDIIVESFLDQ